MTQGERALLASDIDHFKSINDRLAWALYCCGQAQEALGQLPTAAQTYAQTQSLAQDIGHGCRFDASASLARLAWMQGKLGAALRAAEALVSMAALPVGHRAGEASGADGSFDGAESVRLIELTLHQVFAAAGDPRAKALLQRAHREVRTQADTLQDAALRQMFLATIPAHRGIMALWAAQGTRDAS